MPIKILSLGQCAADDWTITQFLRDKFQAEVVPADTALEALTYLRDSQIDLVLVNRIFDRDGDSGLSFITQLKKDAAYVNLPVMLVSNYPDAQQQAVALGALPGFGKAALGDARTMDRLKPVLVKE